MSMSTETTEWAHSDLPKLAGELVGLIAQVALQECDIVLNKEEAGMIQEAIVRAFTLAEQRWNPPIQ